MPSLSLITALPLIGAVALLLLPKERPDLYKLFSLGVLTLTFVLSVPLYLKYQAAGFEGFILEESWAWIAAWDLDYQVSMDGISLVMVLLTTFMGPITALGAFTAIEKRHREFWFHILLLHTAMIGTFVAANLVVFFIYWELMLVPMYFLIGIWGGEKRRMATIKFFIFTAVGSLLMLVGIAWLGAEHAEQTGRWSFVFTDLLALELPDQAQYWLFGAFALAFAIKVPMWPVHTWLPDAHTEAPTAGSVILAGVLLKMGTYGFVRLALPLFPKAVLMAAPLFIVLSVIGIVYGALVAMVQPDVKRLVAYSSVSHLGFCMLGLFALNMQGIQGSVLQGINHGISTGALFLLVGVIYERTHTRLISDYGGIAKLMPVYATIFLVVTMSSVGLPGTNGFVGEFLILLGAFRHAFGLWQAGGSVLHMLIVAVAASGVIFGAVYMLWMVQRVFFGPVTNEAYKNPETNPLTDLSRREVAVFVPLLVMIFWIGFFPKTFLAPLEQPVRVLVERIEDGHSDPAPLVSGPAPARPDAQPGHGAGDPGGGGDHDGGGGQGGGDHGQDQGGH
jgi:NADH-quinone oxidoreductase subunit M